MDIKKPNNRRPKPRLDKNKQTAPKQPAAKKPAPKNDIASSLAAIDAAEKKQQTGKRRVSKRSYGRKQHSKKRKIIIWSLVGVLLLGLTIFGYYSYRIASNATGIFSGSFLDLLKKDELKKDANGRSNILIFGTSEDDQGHSGAQLADSIMMLSIDQKTKEGFTVSIPRDLWVSYDRPCSVGNEGKINAVYYCALEATGGDEKQASLDFADKLSEVVGTDVQYYVAVNYSVVRGLVDSLGGIEVNIQSEDPRGIYDQATGLRLANGTHFIDGDTALDLSRARNAKGGYGLSEGNFDREKNQQLVLAAIQDRALQTGTLVDPNKVVSLTDSLGDNVRTNVSGAELRTALDVAAGVRSSNITSLPLNSPENPLVTTGPYNGQSIVRPIKGLMDYSDIQDYINANSQ